MKPVFNMENVIARAAVGDYSESGYVICVLNGQAAIGNIGHCSCYGTWGSEGEADGCTCVWEGTTDQLMALAEGKQDPALPGRPSNPEDYDHQYLMEVYSDFITWFRKEASVASNL